ncbi:hypothetical protein AB3M83_13310 [Microbacterium sp. 179-B 1A2 NHS]|uniref:hypothetical protein n=1 Tax=Microbacterium sp. 179-B 1A2 NHS TaxID=3142383 RepID=UPI00399F411F
MAVCDTCGNDDDKAFTLTRGDDTGTFDSFECAIHAMAPACAHCGCRIIGHGVETTGGMFCCANCARMVGEPQVVDRVHGADIAPLRPEAA